MILQESLENIEKRINQCQNQIEILRNFTPDDIQIPEDSPIDWIHVAAEAVSDFSKIILYLD